jgi:acyl carrier protein
MKQEITQFIVEQVLGESPDFDLAGEDDLLGSGLISSMGVFRIINFLEETYSIKVPPQDMIIENFLTINAIVAYAGRQIA